MSSKKGAYETNASDTDFRKKYDREANVAKAREQEAKEKEEGRLRYEAKLAGKTILMPAGAATGKRGKGAGFYCQACDLTFKDSLQWVEHENSMQHLRAIGQTGEVQRASAEDVRRRIDEIWERLEREKHEEVVTLGERLEGRRIEDEKEREERKQKRRELAERKKEAKDKEIAVKKEYGEDVRVEGEHDEDDMMASMGSLDLDHRESEDILFAHGI
ncbi:C2H2 finger domain-containing protein [Botrytis cinerea]